MTARGVTTTPDRSGSQPQRTALAWSRTALAAVALAGAATKTAAAHPHPAVITCAVASALAALGFFLCGRRRATYEQGARPPSRAVFVAGVGCAIASGIAAAVLVALPMR